MNKRNIARHNHSRPIVSLRDAGAGALLVIGLALGAASPVRAQQVDTWNGGGTPDGNWTNALNWGGVAPNVKGDDLIFTGSVQPITTNNNNTATAVTNVGWILLNPSVSFTNSGTALTINSGFTNAAQNNQWGTDLTLGANQTFEVAAGTTNFMVGHLFGAGMALTKTGAGTLLVTQGNSYNGGTTLDAGTFQMSVGGTSGGAGASGSPLTINANTILNVVAGPTYTYAYAGSGTINIITSPTTTTGDNTTGLSSGLDNFTGTVNVVPPGNPGTGTTKLADPGGLTTATTIVLATTNGEYFENVASAPAIIAGSPNQGPFYAGAPYGRVRLNGNLTLGGTILLNGNSSIGANAGSETYGGVISDGGNGYGIIVVDNPTITVTAANTYSGYTSISNGTIKLTTGSIANSSVILLDSAGNFDVTGASGGYVLNGTQAISGIGTVKGAIHVSATGQIIPGGNCAIVPGTLGTGPLGTIGTGVAGTLKFNNGLEFNGSSVTFDIASSVALPSDKITVASGVTNNGNTTILLNYLSGFPHAGTYTLMTYSSLNGAGTFVLGGANATNVTLNVGATSLTLTVTNVYGYNNLVWHGDGTANNWDLATANWLNNGSPSAFPSPASGYAAVFDDTGSSTPAINLAINPAPGAVVMSNTVNNYTFSGSGSLNGNMSLTLSGGGALVLNNSNNFSGGTFVNGGTLQVGTNGASGTIAGAILDNSQVIFDHNTTDVVNSAISGTGGVTIAGSGAEVFSATTTMSYIGGTTINTNSTLVINNYMLGLITNNGTFNLALAGSGQLNFTNPIAGTGVITGTSASGVAFAIDGSLVNFAGTISIPPSLGGNFKMLLAGGSGQWNTTNEYTLNIANGATCLVQEDLPTNLLVNVSGLGNGENLGAFRLDNHTAHGPINLLGRAAIGCFQQYTATIYDGISDTNGAGVSQGYGVVIDGGRVVYNLVFPSYGGNTTISNGTLALVNCILTNSPEIDVATSATLDVSAISGFGIPYGWPGALPTQTLGGIGTNGYLVGTITLNSGGSLAVTCSTNGNPALVLTNASSLMFNDNPVTVNVVGGNPLPAGVYPLVAAAADGSAVSGSIAGSTLAITGAGLVHGATSFLTISNSALYLVVNAPAVFSGAAILPDHNIQLTFSGPNGLGYSVHATTNLSTTPVSSWPVIGTGTFGSGPATFSDLDATNYPQEFYIISIP